MPLTEADVINTLGESVVAGMDFHVGNIHVSGKAFATIRDHVRVGNIIVVEGTSSLAFYDNQTDILTTQLGNSPGNLDQRAQLLHECTHALVDVFAGSNTTRHIDELASYIVQHVYLMRSNPSWTVAPNNVPWFNFYTGIAQLVHSNGLDTLAGNGKLVTPAVLEPLRVQLAALPGVNYGTFSKTAKTGANSLKRHNLFPLDVREEVSMRTSSVSYETYPDPSDDYLIATFLERYAATDIAGYGARFRQLKRDFAHCSLGRARALAVRLAMRRPGDRVSELFYDRLSKQGCAILLAILNARK
jgi:hypothetical protein